MRARAAISAVMLAVVAVVVAACGQSPGAESAGSPAESRSPSAPLSSLEPTSVAGDQLPQRIPPSAGPKRSRSPTPVRARPTGNPVVDETLRGLPELAPFVGVIGTVIWIDAVVDDVADGHEVSLLEWEVALLAGAIAERQLDPSGAAGIRRIAGEIRDGRGGVPIPLSRRIRPVPRHAHDRFGPVEPEVWARGATARAAVLGFERAEARVLVPLRQALLLVVYARQPYGHVVKTLGGDGVEELLGYSVSELEGSFVEFRDAETGAPLATRWVATRAGGAGGWTDLALVPLLGAGGTGGGAPPTTTEPPARP